ncbi:hypothetical protein L1887_08354 [Cichorium endivia]|nr:hypothetical protein L1887_08354 [Cichorium endivia]
MAKMQREKFHVYQGKDAGPLQMNPIGSRNSSSSVVVERHMLLLSSYHSPDHRQNHQKSSKPLALYSQP